LVTNITFVQLSYDNISTSIKLEFITSLIGLTFVCKVYVLCFQADVGQDEDMEAARAKAIKLGALKVRPNTLSTGGCFFVC